MELDPEFKQIFNEKIPTKVSIKAVKRKQVESKPVSKKQKLDKLSIKIEEKPPMVKRPRSISCSPLASLTPSPVKQSLLESEKAICPKELNNKINNIHNLFMQKHVKFENENNAENVKPNISRVSSCSSLDSLRSSPVKLADNDYLKHKNVLKESTNTIANNNNNNNNNIIINKHEVDTEDDEIESKLKLLPIGALPLPNFSSQVEQALNMNKSKLFFLLYIKKII
jgi:hypothetical protein